MFVYIYICHMLICSMGLEYLPTFTHKFEPNVGKYSSPMEHLGIITADLFHIFHPLLNGVC